LRAGNWQGAILDLSDWNQNPFSICIVVCCAIYGIPAREIREFAGGKSIWNSLIFLECNDSSKIDYSAVAAKKVEAWL
jgi:hypothetical protein